VREKKTESQREGDIQTDRQRQTETETDRDRDRQTDRQRETYRERKKERDLREGAQMSLYKYHLTTTKVGKIYVLSIHLRIEPLSPGIAYLATVPDIDHRSR